MAIETIGSDVAKERFTVYLPETTVFQVRELSVKQKKRYSKLVNDALLAYFESQEQALINQTDSDYEIGVDLGVKNGDYSVQNGRRTQG